MTNYQHMLHMAKVIEMQQLLIQGGKEEDFKKYIDKSDNRRKAEIIYQYDIKPFLKA